MNQFPPKYRLLKLLRPVLVEELGGSFNGRSQCSRLLGTAAAASAAEIPPVDQRKRKRVSKQERKAMVVAYVNEYRIMNNGKFPTADGTRKQVGGCFYVVRSIIQELEHITKFPTALTPDKTPIVAEDSSTGQDGISKVREVLRSEAPNTAQTDRSTLPELLEYHSNITTAATTNRTSPVEQTTEVIGISEGRDVPYNEARCTETVANSYGIATEKESNILLDVVEDKTQRMIPSSIITDRNTDDDAPLDRSTIVFNEYEISAEDGMTCKGEVGYGSCRSVVDSSIVTKSNEVAVEESATSETVVGLKIQRNREKMSSADLNGDGNRFVGCTEVSETRNSEKVRVHEAVKATTAGSKVSSESESEHPSEILSSFRSKNLAETEEASSPASESDELRRKGIQKTQGKSSSLWGNLKSLANSFISIWK